MKMRTLTVFRITLIALLCLQEVSCRFLKSRTWHEDFVSVPDSSSADRTRVLYVKHKMCIAPNEKPEKVKLIQEAGTGHMLNKENLWSDFLSVFLTHSGSTNEIYSWEDLKKEKDLLKSSYLNQLIGLIIFVIFFLGFFFLNVFYVPVVGCLWFTVLDLMWHAVFHPEMRKLCRRILITVGQKEKVYNYFKSFRPNKGKDKLLRMRRQFRLPFIFREYVEEEIPAELLHSDEDSAGEASSDGFEDLLIKIKSHHAKTPAPAGVHTRAAFLHLLASTERELEGRESLMSIQK